MAGSSLHRLFHLGVVGTMSDAQLLDRFVSRRDEAAEAAFEELVSRHGPTVLRVCRGVLHDSHDAEDAFQAVFLVLANRAGSIRRSGSVASWLFGVAHRVATRARRGASRRRRLDQVVAGQTSEGDLPRGDDPDWEVLHEEIDGLPERLRAPVVLCYLQGLTYAAAAHQLGVSEIAIRGRLARARDRLRHRLTRRGVTVSAGLLVAGSAGQAQAAVPVPLIHSTVRIALGFAAGDTAAALASGVLNAMLLNRVKVAAVLLFVGIGGSSWAWHALAGAADEKGRSDPGPVVQAPAPAPKPQAARPSGMYRLTGSVRVEGTGEPVRGGQLLILLGDGTASNDPDRTRTATADGDGRLLVDLPAGQVRAWTFLAPVGYWAPNNMKSQETFVLSRSEPIHRKDYVVRRGTVWPFRLIGADGRPVDGFIQASTPGNLFRSEADEAGRADLTLPAEAGKVMAGSTMGKPRSVGFASMPVVIPMEWASGFRPEAAKTIERIEGGYRLKDDAGRTATIGDAPREIPDGAGRSIAIGEAGRVEPALVDGKLAIRVLFSEAGRVDLGSLSGRIVDEAGRPIEGVRVAPAFHIREGHGGGGVFPDDKEHEAITDRDGRFLIRAIPRSDVSGKPTSVSLVVRKEGLASLQTPIFSFQPGRGDSPQVLDPIRMEPGVSLSGTVVDPEGRPIEGAWVTPSGGFALRSRFTRTDAAGRFTVRNLPRGLIELGFEYGSLWASGKYLADGTDDGLTIRLRPGAEMLARPAAPATPEPPAIGRPAPPLQVVGWTDGRPRSLADYHGKVVLLDFWGIWCSPCVNGLPSLERLKQKYEPRGVVFLSIHTPGEEIGKIRRFLDFKKATLISALDEGRGKGDNSHNGVTADRYGVRGYPTLVMIDRDGNVAFHTGIGTKEGVAAMRALGKEMGLAESTMTEADFHRLWEAYFSREIEKVLNRP
jgi:RNA polymerase sigma factor (sigma-70 family)